MNVDIFERITRCLVVALTCVLTACGGSGGSSRASNGIVEPGAASVPATSQPAGAPASGASGDSGVSDTSDTIVASASPMQQPVDSSASNTVALVAGDSLSGGPNTPFVSLRICLPGTGTCQTVNDVIVDTGSTGLRLMIAALGPLAASLPTGRFANGDTIGACMQFASGYAWGSMTQADLQIGGESASSLPVQLIGDTRVPSTPASCSTVGTAYNSAAQLGANGILGVSGGVLDCDACINNAIEGAYYDCTGTTGCTTSMVSAAQQAVNPVTRFVTDNNGVIVELPPIGPGGASSAIGTLVFGIGTQANNGLDASARVMRLFTGAKAPGDLTISIGADVDAGGVTTGGVAVSAAAGYIDSGSNVLFYADPTLARCAGQLWQLYCPPTDTARTAIVAGANGRIVSAGLSVANASNLLASGAHAFNNLAAYFPDLAILGLPFFYGRHIAVAIDGAATPAGTGPFVAF